MGYIIRVLLFLCCIFMIDSIQPALASEEWFIRVSGYCGDNITFQLDSEGVLVISGSGDMYYSSGGGSPYPWSPYRSYIESVVIDTGITSIGAEAFSSSNLLTNITLPDSITKIGYNAFSNCTSLRSISIPQSVTKIDSEAFAGCSNLSSVNIPDNLTYIGSSAFDNCKKLENVYVNNLETWLNIEFANNIAYWGGNYSSNPMWYANNLYIGGNLLTELIIPEGYTSIRASTFCGCSSLTSIILPNSLTKIGDYTFYGCSGLTDISLPSSIYLIGGFAFASCSNITQIDIPEGINTIKLGTFSFCQSLNSINIPSSVTKLEDAFYGCKNLNSITIPDSVISIANSSFGDCAYAFTIRSSVNAYAKSWAANNGFNWEHDKHIQDIIAPTSPTCIESGLTEGVYCSECGYIFTEQEVIPALGHAIRFTQSIYDLNVNGDPVAIVANIACGHDVGINIIIPENMVIIEENSTSITVIAKEAGVAMITAETSDGFQCTAICTAIIHAAKQLKLPKALNHIDTEAFSGLMVEEVILCDSIMLIGDRAFAYCKDLLLINIPANTTIGENAFVGCDKLTIICLENSIGQTYAEEHGIPYIIR